MSLGRFTAFITCMIAFAGAPSVEATVLIQALATPAAPDSTGITSITANTHVAGDTRIFMTRKDGIITVHDTATATTTIFNDLHERVTSGMFDQRGLVGLTFDPDYAANHHYYAFLTGPTSVGGPIEAQVVRFTDNGALPHDALPIWRTDLGSIDNHIGGWIDFDRDGMLLLSLGDGSTLAGPDTRNTGQNPGDFFGSILRIDAHADSFADPLLNYAIPGDNPDIPIAGARDEIYAYGVRNPFRNTVTPDGHLIVADVGQALREELTIVEDGSTDRNLGWALREGDVVIDSSPVPGYHAPDLVYDQSEGAAIIGGFVYRGTAVPELAGYYVLGDQVSGNVWAIRYQDGAFIGGKMLLGNIPSLVGFGETPEGELVATQYSFDAATIFSFASDGVSPAVPEPASWAMMLAGFALLGGALRRRSGLQAARRLV